MLDSTSSEIVLLRACVKGNKTAFEAIVKKYQSLVCAITFSATTNLDKSEELAHEAFIRAWTNLSQLEDLTKFRAWLCSIVRNVIRNYIRDKKRDVVGQAESLQKMTEISSAKSEPLEAAIDKEQQVVIRLALEEIPEGYREPLILFYREQKSLRQVAELLELSENAAKTRVSRGRKLLREQVAAMVESTISRTGPGKVFTTAVVVSIAGMAIKGAGVSAAAGVAATGATAVVKTVISGTAAKIIAAAAVVAIGVGAAVTYTHIANLERGPDSFVTANTSREEEWSEDAEDVAALEQAGAAGTVFEKEQRDKAAISKEADLVAVEGKAGENVSDDSSVIINKTGVSGFVIDKQTSRPIKGAEVFCSISGKRHSVVADVNGYFEFLNMQPSERQYVNVIAKDYASRRMVLEILKNKVRKDFKIELARGAKVAGIVSDESGKPIAGATVRTFRLTNLPVTTAEDGEFEIDGLDPGLEQYSLFVTHPNFPTVQVWFVPPEAGQTVLRDVVLIPGVTVHGRITDAQENPVADVVVGTTTSPGMLNSVQCKTDAEGMYTLENVPAGELVLWAMSDKHAPYVERFSLDGPETRKLINIQLDDPWPLRGKIVDARGKAVPGATVRIWKYKGVGSFFACKDKSDSGGRFMIPNAPAMGKMTINVYGEGISGRSTELEMGLEEYIIVVDRAGRLYGKVVEDVTGEPITKFTVRLKYTDRGSNPGYNYSTTWKREGHSFHSAEGLFDTGKEDLTVGAEYLLTVIADGFAPLTIDPVVVPETAEDSARIEFRLKRATTATGRIVDTNDVPIAGARINVLIEKTASYRDNYDSQDTAVSDSNGWFSLAGIGKMQREIYITAHSFGSYRGYTNWLPRDSENFVRVVLEPGAHVFGRVFGPDGQGVPDARLYASATPKETRTDADGYYEFTDLPAGSIHVSVYSSGNSAAKKIETKSGESAELNFGDEAGFTVSGVVRAGENPIKRANVRVNLPDLTRRGGVTDDEGRFQIKGIPEGMWNIEVSCDLVGEWLEETREIVVDANVELDFDLGTGMVSGKIPDSIVETDELKIRAWRWTPKKLGGDLGLRTDWDSVGIAKIDKEGYFSCSYLQAGRYYLSLSTKGDVVGISDVFELGESEHLENTTLRTSDGRIDISVIDSETGEGVPKVECLSVENDREAVFRLMSTDDEGKAECSDLPRGEYVVWAQTPGYLTTMIEGITTNDGVVTPVTVYLERGAVVRFELSAQVRERITAARVRFRCQVTDLDTGELVPKPAPKYTGYRQYDEHTLYFAPARTDPTINLPEGRYEIEYRLYEITYTLQPALLKGVASVELLKGKTTTIIVYED